MDSECTQKALSRCGRCVSYKTFEYLPMLRHAMRLVLRSPVLGNSEAKTHRSRLVDLCPPILTEDAIGKQSPDDEVALKCIPFRVT